ncbi:hypothetical protein EPA93_05290 [Ktedonosporobacter rubrisoli]|uniref:4Fe-4S Mo/W bis-MGD-type domain-containing protein n=1 Tax=Ktedonosporobacter rubrisoli TaxID=2509675 RepID=A0A4P6JJY6_KTERU|nr:molybdopterin-dependent oxidoreductase [Ktedonosporobacter rubrisoli]QBD75448.1 hypothetical protein EPA93_05290 [Ktedonosporobacter rubrisoli]
MAGKRQFTTMCPMNCHPTYCGMTVEVEGDKLLSVKGDPNNPDSHGFLCVRGRATREIFNNSRRLLTPLRRVGPRGSNQWEPCSWEDAYAMLIGAIQETQPERVAFWRGHGSGTTGINNNLILRFARLAGFQAWIPAIICWGLGGYGLALTGIMEANTKEDMGANSRTVIFWGSNIASQPTTAPHLIAARKRGAHIIHIDTRRAEASRHADEVILIRPGTDAALALALAHVIIAEGLVDQRFIAEHTLGYQTFAQHVSQYTPEWAEDITGVEAERVRQLARVYAMQTPAMIVLGGSSMFKHQDGWEASRAISCLPALTGQLGIAGGGLGPRHRAFPHGAKLADILADVERRPGNYVPDHMPSITQAFQEGKIDVLLILGTNMLSSFSDTNSLARGLDTVKLIVGYDVFMNETLRRTADLVLPSTVWLEELGLKDTATHLYLMERVLPAEGQARSIIHLLRELAERLDIANFFPWEDEEAHINALLAPQKMPSGRSLTVADMRELGGYWQRSKLSHISYPDHRFHTPSGKVEFWSERAQSVGLSPLPTYTERKDVQSSPTALRFCQGRTLTAFHAFYDEGQALPALAKVNPEPELWIHPLDAQSRNIAPGSQIVVFNERGKFAARALVTEDMLPGAVWMRDGWAGINQVTSGAPALSTSAIEVTEKTGVHGGQAAYDALVEVQPLARV